MIQRLSLFLFLLPTMIWAQDPHLTASERAVSDGWKMFYLELAAWQATDYFLPRVEGRDLEGYIAYRSGDSICTFFYGAEANDSQVAFAAMLDSAASTGSMRADTIPREASVHERLLIAMRKAIMQDVADDVGDFYAFYQNTGTNIVLLPDPQGHHRGYFMTAPQVQGVMILGNDFEFEFDAEGKLLKRTKLHKELLVISTEGDESGSVHEHGKGESETMTATDICTLLLYSQFSNWKQHVMLSPKYASFWDIQQRQLGMVKRKAWEKMQGK